ncbi:MAG: maleylpyruvate isomerase family mycothiol-dependent enzyme [Lacisediminihabitans sp.]
MAARIDTVDDPEVKAALLLARRGTAYFSRKLNELRDDEFSAPSLLPGWSRRHLIAHVGYNARALTRLTEWAATGIENPMYESAEKRWQEIEYGATLSPLALRNLSEHAAVHLNVEWRDLPKEAWNAEIRTAQGRVVPASATVWMRTREVWLHAVDLNNGGSYAHFPAELIDHLLADVLGNWRNRQSAEGIPNFVLAADDRDVSRSVGDPEGNDSVVLRGPAVDLARWATGRGTAGVSTANGSRVPSAPRWL